MAAVYASDKTEGAREAGAACGNAIRGFADEYSRAQQAAAMAEAGHRQPDRIRALYLQSASVPRIPAVGRARGGMDADTLRMRRAAMAFQLAGAFVVLGLIATIGLAA